MVTAQRAHDLIHALKHYLPTQNPLKDFVHHNTLHAFQHDEFHKAMEKASKIFGYRTYLPLDEYRKLYQEGVINQVFFEKYLAKKFNHDLLNIWREKLLYKTYDESIEEKVGSLREQWKDALKFEIDKVTHPILFRTVCNFLDQGISVWHFPLKNRDFLNAIRELQRLTFIKPFRSKRAEKLLLHKNLNLDELLKIVVEDESLYEHYLFDQQFAHPGWSGMVAVLEENPHLLLDHRKISLEEFIAFELLLEIDALDIKFGEGKWHSAAFYADKNFDKNIIGNITPSELFEIYALWQEIYEWSYYDQVLFGLKVPVEEEQSKIKQVQAILCIDDRECSFRRYIEELIPGSETFGTAGFFNVEFYFQPEHGKFFTKSCPAPVQPNYLIREYEARKRHKTDWHMRKESHGVAGGWLLSHFLGLGSMFRLTKNLFYPSDSPLHVSSFRHMDKYGKLKIEAQNPIKFSQGLQLGFTVDEMTDRIEGLLRSIGLVENFAPLIYVIGHGASSVNNTHYAGYDCGACSGRAGSVNAKVAAYMANHPSVRDQLKRRGIYIPDTTHFIAALHDTTKDEIEFYDEHQIPSDLIEKHQVNKTLFEAALQKNAKERSRRFLMIDSSKTDKEVHEQVKLRALSLFEPRPEWNHATNAICFVGRRSSIKHLFLDRRSFLNSYDYQVDRDGEYLVDILRAVAPVCGGINLEYYFSKVDNHRLGAGTKLPHNVMGLIGVANGMDGDLRTGLPAQMLNIHSPLRLMVIIEQLPALILSALKQHESTYEWFKNNWIHLCALHPETKEIYHFDHQTEEFKAYQPICTSLPVADQLEQIFETDCLDLPVYILKHS
ncbi:YbcC family protein [Schleiferia thermophila]|uniref:Probable inorganic carbon transporter subunit DabA n=1 Tax=Schleiferia thermophila TaxID=884107 RepID=A0A369AB05_9FLAO|nr:DUF2309 domain-containing protein [Schleiferia thermophila]RCX05476.1 hypothetical protein DES35_101763 [Schleiferia thermophila]GCD79023.1 hypothetical protein JCM30197_02700 [Schleiferia thermophila]